MRNYDTKVDNNIEDPTGVLTAAEFNEFITELENLITSAGISLNSGTTDLIAKAVANYATVGQYFSDGGSANSYVLTATGSRKAPTAYLDGMTLYFYAANANSGASTLNLAGLGNKAIKRANGDQLVANDIQSGALIEVVYRAGVDYFVMAQNVKVVGNQNIYDIKTFNTVPACTEDPSAGNDLVRLSYMQSYVAAQLSSAPVGTISIWPTDTAPSGTLLLAGAAVSRTTYADLFALIGTTYGSGDGSTTFNVPDFRGRAPHGKDNMGGSSANVLTLGGTTLGYKGGAEKHTMTTSEMPYHYHVYNQASDSGSGFNFNGSGDGNVATNTTGNGASVPFYKMGPYIVQNFIIKV